MWSTFLYKHELCLVRFYVDIAAILVQMKEFAIFAHEREARDGLKIEQKISLKFYKKTQRGLTAIHNLWDSILGQPNSCTKVQKALGNSILSEIGHDMP